MQFATRPPGGRLSWPVWVLILCAAALPAENRQALLIANGTYANFSSLGTPVNEAQDLAAALTSLGFQVTLLKNASREQMLDALDSFGATFKGKGGTAFFHYGGHGVQVGGKNYLIPVDADIPDERKAATRAVDVDEIMTTLDASGADTSIVCLDACRNNPLPAGAARSASRGLSVVGVKPKNSVIVYAAEAGTTAQDGLFTPALTRALKKPGLSLSDVFTEVRREVYDQSKGAQTPGEYNQLFSQVYLAGAAAAPAPELTPKIGAITVTPGSLHISVVSAGTLQVAGQQIAVPAGANVPLENLSPGDYPVTVTYPDGKGESRTVRVEPGQAAVVAFSYEPPAAAPAPPSSDDPSQPAHGKPNSVGMTLVPVPGGSFTMGMTPEEAAAFFPEWKDLDWFRQREAKDMPPHQVTLTGFLMSSTVVTQDQYRKVMKTNPSNFKGDSLPVEGVSWRDAVAFCNALSKAEKLEPAYSINGTSVSCNFKATGYRLPTEAEWEYAAIGGAPGARKAVAYAGSAGVDEVAWNTANSGGTTHPVAQKKPNGYGLYDMAGNVWQWCWDWYGAYKTGTVADPPGPSGGAGKIKRGGSFSNDAPYARFPVRWVNPVDYKANNVGFRVARAR